MWVVAVITISLVSGAIVYVLSLRVTADDAGGNASGSRWPSRGTRPPVAPSQPLPRSLQTTIPGITFLPISTLRTPMRARLMGVVGLVLVVLISGIVLAAIVVAGGRVFGDALKHYFGT